jgi:uncharacterized phage protein (TIGR02220 family)
MKHIFDVEIAKKYGINVAVILENMSYWIKKNEANDKHFYEGKYWTYNSIKAFHEMFPYMSERQISYCLNKMVELGLIEKGNFNKLKYDQTCWYAITDFGNSILQNCQMEETNLSNGFNAIVKPIPNINTDINTDVNTDIKKENIKEKIPYDEIIGYLNTMACTRYKSTTPKTRALIKARWEEGFKEIDFDTVIKKKCDSWLGTDMEKYLRPETLFGTKFEGYLNERDDFKKGGMVF